MYLVLSAFTSSPISLLANIKASVFNNNSNNNNNNNNNSNSRKSASNKHVCNPRTIFVRLVSPSGYLTAWEGAVNKIFPTTGLEMPYKYQLCQPFIVDKTVDTFYKRGIKIGCLQIGLIAFYYTVV